MHRKGKKALKGKKPRKGEDESADTSSSAAQGEAQPGTRLKPKQKKKLLKEVSYSSPTSEKGPGRQQDRKLTWRRAPFIRPCHGFVCSTCQ